MGLKHQFKPQSKMSKMSHAAMNEKIEIQHHTAASDYTFYKTLLESTKAIPWKIDWQSMQFTYIGPQIQELLGWETDSWVSVNDWVERMHPEDRDRVVGMCVSQSKEGIDHEADYRALKADGSYVWIRDVVHVIRNNNETEALVGFMFDISERKKNEDELIRLKQELEVLSYQDGLTQIANRRLYDIVLAREWENAIDAQTPLAIIMIDIDFFKHCNDHYGHHVGDLALQQIAQLLKSQIRAGDLAARVGGEEFIVILPSTHQEDAMEIAERIRLCIANTPLFYNDSNSIFLTASCSVGSIIPQKSDTATHFIEMIDALLYRAKAQGRNRVLML